MARTLNITDYTYTLPDDRIAYHPLHERDQSKLLVYRDGQIQHRVFREIAELLPPDALLFFNNTKVIPARLLFEKDTGATIEIFLLQPESAQPIQHAMTATATSRWTCAIGNLKRWSEGLKLTRKTDGLELVAALADRDNAVVEFTWTPKELSFAEVVDRLGKTPLPPYIKRAAEREDKERYQTVYAHHEGAVAAPTAGLHITPRVLEQLALKGVATDYLTLHVGAGTFQPVKTEDALAHTMHEEQLVISKQNVDNLLTGRMVVPVGTTSMRVLESLYWYGVKLSIDPQARFYISQTDAYDLPATLSKEESLALVREKIMSNVHQQLVGSTAIYIHPGYDFKICEALVTNFHQPGSTLILLVAAFVGNDWKKIYEAAMTNNYRFLSYGDSSLLFKK